MYKKVLVAEDLDSISIAVIQVLEELQIPTIHHVKYCDEGLLKVKKALNEKEPYDLLITDLSFKTDHRKANIESGGCVRSHLHCGGAGFLHSTQPTFNWCDAAIYFECFHCWCAHVCQVLVAFKVD